MTANAEVVIKWPIVKEITTMIENSNLHFSFVEIKKGPNSLNSEHAPHMPINTTWWNYIQTAYFLPDKIVQMRNTTSSNSVARTLFFEFSTVEVREEFLNDAQVLAGFNELVAYDESNSFKLVQANENRSYPLNDVPAVFPMTQWLNGKSASFVGEHEISGVYTERATP